ncbi:MAG: Helix-turn-helix domain protein [Ilumatobacteraceae bacterium]|nr:Helix-turn-helix domain protein [Ilumatobacteraceae bacterium]
MNRLVAYRSIEGLSQSELGEMLGVSIQTISNFESGRRPFKGDLTKLGYAPERFDIPDMSEPLHRQRASTPVSSRKRAQELLRLAGEVFIELRDRTPRTPMFDLDRYPTPTTLDEIEDDAIDVRYSLQHEKAGPIHNFTATVERAGVCIVPIAGLDGMDGLSSWVDGVPVIGVNPGVPGDRFRLTVGHELAHLMLHTRKTDNTEHEANRFAAALLFPRDDFDAAMPARPTLRDFVGLKKSWGVSVAALVYRAHELGHLNDERYRSLQIQMSTWRRNEPGKFEPVHGQLFAKLVEGNGGVDSVAGAIGVRRKHLAELVNWSHLRLR